MKRVLTAAVLIPLVLLAVCRLHSWFLVGTVAAVALLAMREFFGIADAYGVKPFRKATYALCVLFFAAAGVELNWSTTRNPGVAFLLIAAFTCVAFGPMLMLTIGMRREGLATALPSAAFSFLAIPYIVLPMVSLVFIREAGGGGLVLLFFLFFVVWTGDICAYFVGSSIGRHLMAPRISPKKTWEGAVASFLGSVLVGSLVLSFSDKVPSVVQGFLSPRLPHSTSWFAGTPMWVSVLLAIPVNVAAQTGDLVESMIKRGAGLKDSGSLLPGHGGVLDRIDALLFAAPIVWYYAILFAISDSI